MGRIDFNSIGGFKKVIKSDFKSFTDLPPITKPSMSYDDSRLSDMDAKAIALKVKIQKKVEARQAVTQSVGYHFFTNDVSREVGTILQQMKKELLPKINPINANNIEQIKSKLEFSFPAINAELGEKIKKCNNPDELFDLIRENIDGIINGKMTGFNNESYIEATKELFSKARKTGITPELEDKYQEIRTIDAEGYREIVNLLTPKSMKPEVLQIEQEVRTLGVGDVNFSDDFEQAQLIKDAIIELKKGGIPLPKSITLTPVNPFGYSGMTTPTVSKFEKNGYVYLPTSSENALLAEIIEKSDDFARNTVAFKESPLEYRLPYLEEMNKKQLSTKNNKHSIFHEIFHTFQPNTLDACLSRLSEEDIKVAQDISLRAQFPNGKEVMPEMGAKLMDGQKLTDRQMALYLKLGGIVPQF